MLLQNFLKDELDQVLKILSGLGFPVKKVTAVNQLNDVNQRIIRLKIIQGNPELILQVINKSINGVTQDPLVIGHNVNRYYNPLFIRGLI